MRYYKQHQAEIMLNAQAQFIKPMTEFEQLQLAREVIQCEASALQRLAKNLPADFHDAAETIFRCEGSVVVTGMGKAGWIGQKISASFASTGTCSHFLHPAEAIHGDLGRVGMHDLVLVFSNSGETEEILHLLPTFQKLRIPVIAVTGKDRSTLVTHSSLVLHYGAIHEAGHLGLAPSTSTAMMLAMGDALALVVSRMKQFSAADFARFHPGGSLGKRLSVVDEIMRPIDVCRVANENEKLRDIYIRFGGHSRRSGVVLVTGENDLLTGLFTDSDLARLLEKQRENQFDRPMKEVMTKTPVTIQTGERTSVAVETLACRNLSELPVINRAGQPLGLIDITDVLSFFPTASS
jgi:arabinose-5-phosphate isomerase